MIPQYHYDRGRHYITHSLTHSLSPLHLKSFRHEFVWRIAHARALRQDPDDAFSILKGHMSQPVVHLLSYIL